MATVPSPSDTIPALGALVRRAREERGLSEQDLIFAAGYRKVQKGLRHLRAIESGEERFPRRDRLARFTRVLELDEHRILAATLADFRVLDVPVPFRLIVRIMAAVHGTVAVPEGLTREKAEDFAARYAAKHDRRVCLVISKVRGVYIEPDGSRSESHTLPWSSHSYLGDVIGKALSGD